jgi:hypothetical protein
MKVKIPQPKTPASVTMLSISEPREISL